MGESLRRVIKSAMRPLALKYSLQVADEEDDGSYSAVRYSNGATGLKVGVDWTELRPFLTIYQLAGGQFPAEGSSLGVPHWKRSAFDADDLLALRGGKQTPVGKMFPKRDDEVVQPLLADYATALDEFASDVLSGDFTVFEELNRIVIAREKESGGSHSA